MAPDGPERLTGRRSGTAWCRDLAVRTAAAPMPTLGADMSVAPVTASPGVAGRRNRLRFDRPVDLPTPRGSVSATLLEVLAREPSGGVDPRSLVWAGDDADATTDED